MLPAQVTIDADSRYSSGRGLRTLADEYAQFTEGLPSRWRDETPLPYEKFAGPYRELRRTLLEECRQLGERLRHTGDGQVGMADMAMLRQAMGSIGRILKSLFRTPQARRVDIVAGRLHDRWRAPRRLNGGGYEPRIKTTTDKAWARKNGTDQVDIANTDYKRLPRDWQKENRDSADVAVRLLRDGERRGADLRSEKFMEEAGEEVHKAWLRRNGEWAPAEQKLPYRQLSELEKEKDREVVRAALGL